MSIHDIQSAVRESSVGGWLFCDYQNRDPLAYRILGLPPRSAERRWFYFVPGKGEPVKLVHFDEAGRLDALPGDKVVYRSWSGMQRQLKEILGDVRRVAMQYSPLGRLPSISYVDAGTVEMVRNCGVEVATSAELVQRFEGQVDDAGYATHVQAGERVHEVLEAIWQEIRAALAAGRTITERDVQQSASAKFRELKLTADGDLPVVAVGEHAVHWRHRTKESDALPLRQGDTLLVDAWARLEEPRSVYYSTCWCAYLGSEPPDDYERMFRVVVGARDAALAFLRERVESGGELRGWEVDKVCRGFVTSAGYGEQFVHPTGHSIGRTLRSAGVAIDSLETQDERLILPGSLFTVAPGIYAPDRVLGVRTGINVYVDHERRAVVSGPAQDQLVLLP